MINLNYQKRKYFSKDWRVIYRDKKVSKKMTEKEANDYAEIFGGEVVKVVWEIIDPIPSNIIHEE